MELVDNPIEELLKSLESGSNRFSKSNPLRVEVFVHDSSYQIAPIFERTPEAPPTIVVQDNAGGVDRNHFSCLFRFGEAGELAENGISAYGRGGKRARLKLGNRHVVISRRGDRQYFGYVIIKTAQDTNWKVPIFESPVPTIPKNTTRVAVTDLLFPITNEWIGQLREQLTITYSQILSEGRAGIWLNGTRIEPVSIEDAIKWSGGTNIEPALIPFSYEAPVIEREKDGSAKTEQHTVNGEVTIGLLRSTTTKGHYGFDIICNGRLLQRFVKSELGFCPKETGGWGIQPSQKISMVRGVVYLSGPSKAMPWRSNKVEFDDEKVAPLRQAIVKTCEYWVRAGDRIKGLGTSRISGTLDHPFKGKIRTLSKPPVHEYRPPSLVGPEEIRIAFVTTKNVVDQAKRVFELDSEKDVRAKAKEIFEEAIRTEAAMYKGSRASHEVDLRDLRLSSQIRTKLGMAGVQIEDLVDISKKEEKDAIKELCTTVDQLRPSEARRIYRAARSMK